MSARVAAEREAVPAPDEELAPAPPVTRMAIALLSLLGLFVAGYLSLYKLGWIGELQCSIGGCQRVQNSPWAVFLGLPVAVWGVGAYVTLLAVAMMGLQPRWVEARWVPLSLFALSAVGVAFSGWLTWLEAYRIHAWCQWCVVSAILITLIFLLSIPEVLRARRTGRTGS